MRIFGFLMAVRIALASILLLVANVESRAQIFDVVINNGRVIDPESKLERHASGAIHVP